MIDGTLHRGARFLTFALAVVGAAFSLALVFVVTQQPQLIEKKLQSFAIEEVEARAIEALDAVQTEATESDSGLLQSLAGRFADDAELLERRDAAIADIVASVAQQRCQTECTGLVARAALTSVLIRDRIADLRIGQRTVGEFVAERYEATVEGLKSDLTTFGLANLVAFLSLIFLSIFKGRFGARILPMAILLTVYVFYAMYWYVYTQDWAAAILFNNWAAGGYVATMIVVYFLLIDFTFFNGSLTDGIINAITTTLGGVG